MRVLRLFFILFCSYQASAQDQLDENIQALRSQYNESPNIRCEIDIKVDVVGMTIPDKRVFVEFRGEEKPKVKGEGLSLLPKRGTVDQFRKMLNSPMQAIFLSKRGNNLIYKLVSLDQKSDWITADIIFDEKKYLIYESIVNTRKFGTFKSEHSYKEQIYPTESIVTFDIKKFKLPLKFIGSEQASHSYPKADEQVKGKITLSYTYL